MKEDVDMPQKQLPKSTITVVQMMMIYTVMGISPAIRFLPAFAVSHAKEASWLSPLAAMLPAGIVIFMLNTIFNSYPQNNCGEIIEDILGKFAGKAVMLLLLLWVVFMVPIHIRNSAERLVSSIYPNVNITFFIISTTLMISYILRSGAVVLARLGQILLPILAVLFFFVSVLLIPNIRPDALLPVSTQDVIPVFKASLGTTTILGYIFIIFFFSENIVEKKSVGKVIIPFGFLIIVILLLLLLTTVGIMGHTVVKRAPIPFLTVVKQISVMDTIENIESVAVAIWILSDVILIATMSIISLNIMKYLFHLPDTKNIINIYLTFLTIIALGVAKNRLELDILSSQVAPYLNTVLGHVPPIILFVVGKIRKKL